MQHLGRRGECADMHYVLSAACLAQYPGDFFEEPGCLGAEILTAAGFSSP